MPRRDESGRFVKAQVFVFWRFTRMISRAVVHLWLNFDRPAYSIQFRHVRIAPTPSYRGNANLGARGWMLRPSGPRTRDGHTHVRQARAGSYVDDRGWCDSELGSVRLPT